MEPDVNISAIAHKSFYSNIDGTFSKYFDFCSVHQAKGFKFPEVIKWSRLELIWLNILIENLPKALDTDYKGNTEELHIDRGHLMPNGMANQVAYLFFPVATYL